VSEDDGVRIEWRVYIEPWPEQGWRPMTVSAVDAAHAQILARHRKFARITRLTTRTTFEEVPLEP
jgi:hypothetical protein